VVLFCVEGVAGVAEQEGAPQGVGRQWRALGHDWEPHTRVCSSTGKRRKTL
jgi:hypothetical protein